jgi:predicted RNA-binding protein YlqC (UPF0109 family)
MQPFLDYVVKALVDQPESASVTPVERNNITVFELRLHPDDVGRVIGRQGGTIHALRNLLMAGSAKQGLRTTLEIVENNVQKAPPTR